MRIGNAYLRYETINKQRNSSKRNFEDEMLKAGRGLNSKANVTDRYCRSAVSTYGIGLYSPKEILENLEFPIETSGNLKRGEQGFTFLTPNGITYIPYDGDPEKAWEADISSSDYQVVRDLFSGNSSDSETGTTSEIILRPDGSRVLVLTMKMGGMETSISIKISEPTDFPNDAAGPEERQGDMQDSEPNAAASSL